jgi:hypothetical protein
VDRTDSALWLHAYSGKDNGLMIVGTSDAMRALAQQLLAASDAATASTSDDWPKEIARPTVIGPYTDVPDYGLSFHLRGSAPLEKVVPHRRRNMWWPIFLAIAALAATGLATIWLWFLGHVL